MKLTVEAWTKVRVCGHGLHRSTVFSFMLFWRLSSDDVSVLRVQLQQDEILMQSFLLGGFSFLT